MATYDEYNQPVDDQGAGYMGPPATSGLATTSLVLGILSIPCLWIISGLPAIILGMIAIGSINRSRGRLMGKGLAVGGIVTGILGSLCWTGGGVLFYVGLEEATKQVRIELNNNPVARQHLGEVKSVSINWTATMEYAEKHPNEQNMVVFDLEGSKGRGKLIAKSGGGAGGKVIERGRLQLPSGEEIEISGNGAPDRRRK
jgi:hypothetical protein